MHIKPDTSTPDGRLEYLESKLIRSQGVAKLDRLTPSEFAPFVASINERLATLWKDDRKVRVLRLAVQVAKMMGDAGD